MRQKQFCRPLTAFSLDCPSNPQILFNQGLKIFYRDQSHHLIRYNNIYSDILLYTTIYQHIFDTPPNTTIHQHIIYHDMPPPLHSRLGAQLKLPAAVGQRPFRAKVYSYLCLFGGFKQTNRKRNVKISLWCGCSVPESISTFGNQYKWVSQPNFRNICFTSYRGRLHKIHQVGWCYH